MNGILRTDLGGIDTFADRLDTLRSDLDLAGEDFPITVGPLMPDDPGSLYDVQAGFEEFLKARAAAASVVDSYLSALSAMARQSVTKIQQADSNAALALERTHPIKHRPVI